MNHATGGTTLGACRRGRDDTTPIAGHGQHSAADARIAAVLIASLDRLGRFQRRAEVVTCVHNFSSRTCCLLRTADTGGNV